MAKKNKKLALKKETLRSLSDEQLGAVAGGTLALKGYSIVVPPKGTFGCTTDYNFDYNYEGYP